MARFPFIVPPRLPRTSSAFASEDASSRAAASQLAESINRYWADLGYDAEARVVEMRILDGRGSADEFGVVSNSAKRRAGATPAGCGRSGYA